MEWRSLSSGPALFHSQSSGGYASMGTDSWNDVDEDESVERPSYRSMEAAGPPEVPPPLKRQLAVAEQMLEELRSIRRQLEHKDK